MKIISYNVNGIRAALKKGFAQWLAASNADMVCLQEIKAHEDQVDLACFREIGFPHIYWMAAEKRGYSGVAILSKHAPVHIEFGCSLDIYDCEGRVLRADFDSFSLMSIYMPSGTTGDIRQAFKMQWLNDFFTYIMTLRQSIPNLIISGDYNICHNPIDIHDPVRNARSSGFLPEERAWVSKFLDAGFIDTFRFFNKMPHHYTWWTYRQNARARNLGWRIDYHMASETMKDRLSDASILKDVEYSDHCPIVLEIN